jgi:hypothetical protein
MSTATRKITIVYSGDVDGTQELSAAINTDSPAMVEIKTLAAGANTITVPTAGTVPTAVTIVPPTDNTVTLTLKKVTGDTGIRLHDTDPTTIALDSSVTSFCLTAGTGGGTEIIGVRLYWS